MFISLALGTCLRLKRTAPTPGRYVYRARNTYTAVIALFVVSVMGAMTQYLFAISANTTQKDAAGETVTVRYITVSEGTNMAVTVSPNHKQIIMDLQGLLWRIPVTGGKATQITSAIFEASHPSWSSKGDLVAVQSYAGGTFHIWTMKPDGTDLRQITFGHGDDREPQFSPDGTKIAFASDRAMKGSYDIWVVDVATGALRQWTSTDTDEFEPAWSPSGEEIAYVSGVGIHGTSIEAVTASGTKRTLVSLPDQDGRLETPSWSPDGKTISYTKYSGAGMFMNSSHLMVSGKSVDKQDDAFPFPAAWLNQNSLIYTANGHILRVNLLTHEEKPIAFKATIKSIRPQYKPKQYEFDSAVPIPVKGILAPALSPDGKQIAFTAVNQLWIMEIGKSPRQITHDSFYKQGPQWSPDGKWLAYVSDKDGTENIYIRNVSTGDEKRVAPSETSAEIFPSWSPDGKRIAFQDQTGVTSIVDIATDKVHAITPSLFASSRPSWSSDGKTIAIAAVKPYTKRFREGTNKILTIDISTDKMQYSDPAPFESITTRGEDGPVYSSDGKEIAFVMDDLLYVMPVDLHGVPDGPAIRLNDEVTDAPTWSGDSKELLYLHEGKLRIISRKTSQITPVPFDLKWHREEPHQRILIHAGRFWKGEGPEEQTDVDIVVANNRIASITPHSNAVPNDVDRVIDASRFTVLPGLWENHVHPSSLGSFYYGDRLDRLYLSYGVTELRDLADQAYRAKEQQEALDSGARVGPRLFATGEAIDGERVYYSMMIPTTSEVQMNRELERLKALDFDLVKLYVRLSYAWQVKGSAFAHKQMGVETASHYLLPAVSLGNDGMSHISATARTGYAYSRSNTGNSYEDVRKMLVDSGMFTITTTFNFSLYAEDPSMATDRRQEVSPPWEHARLVKYSHTAQTENQTENLKRLQAEESTVANILRKGAPVLAGTDSPIDIPATSLHLNLRAQVKYGLQPWQALETVTSLPAKAYGLTKDLGTLEKGKLADLIIVSGNPLANIKDAANVQCVMKNGVIHSVSEIIAPFAPLKSSGTDNQMCSSSK